MAEDTGSVNKLSGIWMQLDAILHREKRNNIFENRGDYTKVVTKKKEKLKLSTGGNKYLLKDENLRYGELTSLEPLAHKKKERSDKYKTNDKFYEVGDLEGQIGYVQPLVECSWANLKLKCLGEYRTSNVFVTGSDLICLFAGEKITFDLPDLVVHVCYSLNMNTSKIVIIILLMSCLTNTIYCVEILLLDEDADTSTYKTNIVATPKWLSNYWLIAAGLIASQGSILSYLGQPFMSRTGGLKFWCGDVLSRENSQHLTDWYTFTHIIHGIGYYWILGLVTPRSSMPTRFIIAVMMEVLWEIVENTPTVIDRYRRLALANGYSGDSVKCHTKCATYKTNIVATSKWLSNYWLIAAALIVSQGSILCYFGQPIISRTGGLKLWCGDVKGPENSQQLTDWYTFTHIIHGIGYYWILRLVTPTSSIQTRFIIAVVLEVLWEIVENTPMVINRYRQTALANGYSGDSVVNSISDTLAMFLGFYMTTSLPIPVVIAFNLSRVSAQLERLMGTNVVRLTDRKYMMELRQRIHEDFNEMLAKRIENREVKEMERQRNLFMEGKITQCSENYNSHPIFIVNQTAGQPIVKRRSKLKTNRQKNAERLIRQGAKWEKERQKLHEIERQRELEEKARQEAALNMVNEYHAANKDHDMKMPRFRNSVADSELVLKELSDDDNDKSTCQSGKSKAKERRRNSILKNEESERTTKYNLRTGRSTDDDDDGNENDEISNNSKSHRSQMVCNGDNVPYEDPMVSELKQTESVKDMYKLANDILCGRANSHSTISEESSADDEELGSDEQ
ncbi:UPF0314 protein [Pseudolycoriella hygida]|uniref:UPF0314 protein n=1 Tax=Pseudolycoriella hygida TaxID=35572 RepID=A0A9Q0NFK1_9DIPT|nr:UPF0314 protein [Pseudolycoriella hygida]